MDGYKTFYDPYAREGEIVEKKSRFIAIAACAETEEQAALFIESVKKRHINANHNVYAYRISKKSTLERFSDDGEPARTAGLPVLDVLRGLGIINGVIVVTRYFGGTLLGTGGLVRAYSKAAALTAQNSLIIEKNPYSYIIVKSDYSLSGKIQHEISAADNGIFTGEILYTDMVEFHIYVLAEKKDAFIKKITDLSAACADINYGGDFYGAVVQNKFILF